MTRNFQQLLNASLARRVDINPDLAIFRIQPDTGWLTEFQPGQFCTIGLPKRELEPHDDLREADLPRHRLLSRCLIRRAYSIASPATQRDSLDLLIVRVEHGGFTPLLWDLELGDRLYLDEKIKGNFTLDDVPAGKNIVMISTGTGLAPFVSMLMTYRGTGRWNKLVIIHGARLAADLAYSDLLTQIAGDDPTVHYLPTLTREPDPHWPGLRGRVNHILDNGDYEQQTGCELDPADTHIFLCGNPAMIDQLESSLAIKGFTPHNRRNPNGNIHFERFW